MAVRRENRPCMILRLLRNEQRLYNDNKNEHFSITLHLPRIRVSFILQHNHTEDHGSLFSCLRSILIPLI